MRNILIIITKGDTGGAQVSVYNLAKELRCRGVNVTVGFGKGNFLANKLKSASMPFVNFKYLERSHGIINALMFMLEIRSYLKANNYDVVHFNSSNTLFGALAAKFLKKKPLTVFTFRGLSIIDPSYTKNGLLKWFYKMCFKFLLIFIDRQVYVSEDNRSYCKKFGLAKNETVIYNGLDKNELQFLPREEARIELTKIIGKDISKTFLIGSIGRFAYQKNYEFLIKQVASLRFLSPKSGGCEPFGKGVRTFPDSIIVIIGDGPEKRNYQELIKNNNLQNYAFLTGDIPDAYQYLKAFDLFVLPSRYEGLPITLIETLFAGIPALATNVGGNREVLEDAGMFYELDDATKFCESMVELANNEQLSRELSQKAIARSPLFSIERTCDNYLKIYSGNK